MGTRLELQSLLEIMSPNVYFQPPPSVSMTYPCIVYRLDDIGIQNANNKPYLWQNYYLVTAIDRNPDSYLLGLLKQMPGVAFDRSYTANNLNHFVFRVFF